MVPTRPMTPGTSLLRVTSMLPAGMASMRKPSISVMRPSDCCPKSAPATVCSPATVRTRVLTGSRASAPAPWRCAIVTVMPRSSAMTSALTTLTRALMFRSRPAKNERVTGDASELAASPAYSISTLRTGSSMSCA